MKRRPALIILLLILAIGSLFFARHALNFGIRPTPTELDRAAEMWAHERLITLKTAPASEPDPFETDGCSGGMSVIWRDMSASLPVLQSQIGQTPPWEKCCIAHDRAYHLAGDARDPEASFTARSTADWALRQCIVETGARIAAETPGDPNLPTLGITQAYILIGDMIYSAVRIGGGPCSGLPWRWGFGYPNCLPGTRQN
ncbi:MAG: hypothetical protein HKP40_08410 [Litoreibacter sp.]|nr:hypothetical protein [Litoreibacter sp.]